MTGIGVGLNTVFLRYLGKDEDKAFPGAFGWGAQSLGGRGGTVLQVTNLNDSGVGSLRTALLTSGARIVVFRVAGLIELESDITIVQPYLTIAGQTAPGGGIHISGGMIALKTHNIIIRYLRWRGEANSFFNINPGNGMELHDIILDHCSASWGENDTIDIWHPGHDEDIYNITIQNCIIAEPDPAHPTGMMFGATTNGTDYIDKIHHISIHHNLFIFNNYRNPRVKSQHTEVINNVVYSWQNRIGGTERASEVDWANNYILDGPMSNTLPRNALWHKSDGDASLYVSGNIVPHLGYTTPDADNWPLFTEFGGGGAAITLDYRRFSKLEPAPFDIPIQSAYGAYTSVLADVGANARLDSNGNWVVNIDETDTRLLANVVAGTGWDDYTSIIVPGTIGAIAAGTPYTDTDSDGMPDDWENAKGLNPNDAADGPMHNLKSWYTNLEVFLNGL